MAAIKRPRETRNGRFWMLIELKKSCIGESDAGNQTPLTATKPRNARLFDLLLEAHIAGHWTPGEASARFLSIPTYYL